MLVHEYQVYFDFICRKDKGIQVTDTYQYPEPHTDQSDRTFERPPYCARFQIPNAGSYYRPHT